MCRARAIIIFLIFLTAVTRAQQVSVSGFIIYQDHNRVVLRWVLDSGATCNGITIMRATDTLQFNVVGSIPGTCGSGTSATSYSFTDNAPVLNGTNYYKLKLGISEYSVLRQIYFRWLGDNSVLVKQDKDALLFEFNNQYKEEFTLQLFNEAGQAITSAYTTRDDNILIETAGQNKGLVFYKLYGILGNYRGKIIIK